MPTELKLIITFIALWFILMALAMPGTDFYKWGARQFKTYPNFLNIIAAISFIPALIVCVYWLWTL